MFDEVAYILPWSKVDKIKLQNQLNISKQKIHHLEESLQQLHEKLSNKDAEVAYMSEILRGLAPGREQTYQPDKRTMTFQTSNPMYTEETRSTANSASRSSIK